MGVVALELRVFIGGSPDVLHERLSVERVLLDLGRTFRRNRLHLRTLSQGRDVLTGLGKPRDKQFQTIEECELVVIIFGRQWGVSPAGDGLLASAIGEVTFTMNLVERGMSDDLFIYFLESPEGSVDSRLQGYRQVLDEQGSLAYRTYYSATDLEGHVRADVMRWLDDRWLNVPAICDFALQHSPPAQVPAVLLGENRLAAMTSVLSYERILALGDEIGASLVKAYQQHGPKAADRPLTCAVSSAFSDVVVDDVRSAAFRWSLARSRSGPPRDTPLFRSRDGTRCANTEWFSLLCAVGLIRAVIEGDVSAVSRLPYINPIHQYLKALAGRDHTIRQALIQRLLQWLTGYESVTGGLPVARNFAAYVLGMLEAKEAEDALILAFCSDQGVGVRQYAATALGRIRSRRALAMLVSEFSSVSSLCHPDQMQKLLSAQAICRIIGVANYEM